MQLRKGPNKVSFLGLLQPISDAIKLAVKEMHLPSKRTKKIFFFSPLFALFIRLAFWGIIPFSEGILRYKFSVGYFLVILGVGIYPLFFRGWSSKRKYRAIGAGRGVRQSISYEISIALFLIRILRISKRLNLRAIRMFIRGIERVFILVVLYYWFVCCVAESNRTPFDFSEGESELVSGFNTEYRGGLFALIFIAEYGRIMGLRAITSLMFFVGESNRVVLSLFFILRFIFIWIWLRATYPRYRYDKLMRLAWKNFLPVSLILVIFYLRFRVLI